MVIQADTGRRNFLKGLLGLVAAGVPAIGTASPRPILVQHSPLAGFQYHEGDKLWPRLRVGQPLTLTREPDNRYDARAVRVDWRGRKLGYLPRRDNAAVSQMLDRGERMTARIAGLAEEARSPWERVGLEVYLEPRS